MIQIRRILCPTDLTTESDEALRYATALASAYGAKLMLVYCRQPGSIVEWSTASSAARIFETALFTYLDTNELRTLDWEPVIIESDDVGTAIINEAFNRSADLIVMRSRRRPHAAVLLGSTAESVCRKAPCPVLVTHPSEREWVGLSTCEIDLKRLLVAYDNSADADVAAKYGVTLGEEYQAEVHLLHVMNGESSKLSDDDFVTADERAAEQLQALMPPEASLWCNFVTAVSWGQPAAQIVAYAKEHEIDLICMGASGTGFSLDKLFGSTVDSVLRHAPCPVLVSRPMKQATASIKAA